MREIATTRFLHSNPGPCNLRTGKHQTTLRVWTANELMARDIVLSCLKLVTIDDNLQEGWSESAQCGGTESKLLLGNKNDCSSRQEKTLSNGAVPSGPKCPKGGKAMVKFGLDSVTKYFKRKEVFEFDIEMAALKKEKRLEIKKKKELPWRKKIEEYNVRKMAKDWILEIVVPEVMMVGSMTMLDRSKKVVDLVVEDSWTSIMARKELRERLKTDRLRRVVVKKKEALEKIQRKERL